MFSLDVMGTLLTWACRTAVHALVAIGAQRQQLVLFHSWASRVAVNACERQTTLVTSSFQSLRVNCVLGAEWAWRGDAVTRTWDAPWTNRPRLNGATCVGLHTYISWFKRIWVSEQARSHNHNVSVQNTASSTLLIRRSSQSLPSL